MNLYEKVMVLDPNLGDKAVEDIIKRVKDVITRQGGEIFKSENWGHKKLAYELNKRQKGYYILLYFKAPPSVISELEKFCRVTDSIVKFIVIRLKKKKQIEAMMSSQLTKSGVETSSNNIKTDEGESTRRDVESRWA